MRFNALIKSVAVLVTCAFLVTNTGVERAFALQPESGVAPLADSSGTVQDQFLLRSAIVSAASVISLLEGDEKAGSNSFATVEDMKRREVFLPARIGGMRFADREGEMIIEINGSLVVRYFDPSRKQAHPEDMIPAGALDLDGRLNDRLQRAVYFTPKMGRKIRSQLVDAAKASVEARDTPGSSSPEGTSPSSEDLDPAQARQSFAALISRQMVPIILTLLVAVFAPGCGGGKDADKDRDKDELTITDPDRIVENAPGQGEVAFDTGWLGDYYCRIMKSGDNVYFFRKNDPEVSTSMDVFIVNSTDGIITHYPGEFGGQDYTDPEIVHPHDQFYWESVFRVLGHIRDIPSYVPEVSPETKSIITRAYREYVSHYTFDERAAALEINTSGATEEYNIEGTPVLSLAWATEEFPVVYCSGGVITIKRYKSREGAMTDELSGITTLDIVSGEMSVLHGDDSLSMTEQEYNKTIAAVLSLFFEKSGSIHDRYSEVWTKSHPAWSLYGQLQDLIEVIDVYADDAIWPGDPRSDTEDYIISMDDKEIVARNYLFRIVFDRATGRVDYTNLKDTEDYYSVSPDEDDHMFMYYTDIMEDMLERAAKLSEGTGVGSERAVIRDTFASEYRALLPLDVGRDIKLGANYRGPLGADSYGQNFGSTAWYPDGNGYSRHVDALRAHFAKMRELRITTIRTGIVEDGRALMDEHGNVTGYTPLYREDLDTLFTESHAAGIRLELTLVDFLMGMPGDQVQKAAGIPLLSRRIMDAGKPGSTPPQKLVGGVYLFDRQQVFEDEAMRGAFIQDFLVPFLLRYGNHPALKSIDIGNELGWLYRFDIDPEPFIRDVAAAVRKYAPRIKLTIGVETQNFETLSGVIGIVDEAGIHYYNMGLTLEETVALLPQGVEWSLQEIPGDDPLGTPVGNYEGAITAGCRSIKFWSFNPGMDQHTFSSEAARDAAYEDIADYNVLRNTPPPEGISSNTYPREDPEAGQGGRHPAQVGALFAASLPEGRRYSFDMIIAAMTAFAMAATMKGPAGQEKGRPGRDTLKYTKDQEAFLSRMITNSGPVLLRVPVNLVELDESGNVKELLGALSKAENNIFVHLYRPDNEEAVVAEEVYARSGIEYRSFSGDINRTNTISLLAVEAGTKKTELANRIQMSEPFQKSIVVPVAEQGDPAGVLRGTLFGLRLIETARNPRDRDFIKETIDGYQSLVNPYARESLDLSIEDVLSFVFADDINAVLNFLDRIVAALPIERVDPSELREAFEKARQIVQAA